jgi:hypothetical protein
MTITMTAQESILISSLRYESDGDEDDVDDDDEEEEEEEEEEADEDEAEGESLLVLHTDRLDQSLLLLLRRIPS